MSCHAVALEGVLQLGLHLRRDDYAALVVEAEFSDFGKLLVDLSTDGVVESDGTSNQRIGSLVAIPVSVSSSS